MELVRMMNLNHRKIIKAVAIHPAIMCMKSKTTKETKKKKLQLREFELSTYDS